MSVVNEYTLESSQKALAAGSSTGRTGSATIQAATTAVEQELYRDAYSWLTGR